MANSYWLRFDRAEGVYEVGIDDLGIGWRAAEDNPPSLYRGWAEAYIKGVPAKATPDAIGRAERFINQFNLLKHKMEVSQIMVMNTPYTHIFLNFTVTSDTRDAIISASNVGKESTKWA